jgi:GNAT superfamily N-acetyltransferase
MKQGVDQMTVSIRPLTADDADAVTMMSQNFQHYLSDLGDPSPYRFNRARYLADGFGSDPAFGGHLALLDDQPVGYLLHCPTYDADLAIRQLMIIDFWVEPATRGHGIGRKLMQAAAEHARIHAARRLIWAVFKPNRLAYDFYYRLGAVLVDDLDWMTLPVETS